MDTNIEIVFLSGLILNYWASNSSSIMLIYANQVHELWLDVDEFIMSYNLQAGKLQK